MKEQEEKRVLTPRWGAGPSSDVYVRDGWPHAWEGQYRGLGELSYTARSRLKEHTAEHQALETALQSSGETKGPQGYYDQICGLRHYEDKPHT